MIDTNIRSHIQRAFDAFVISVKLTKLHPNVITIIAFIVGLLSALCIALGKTVLAFALLWVSGALDVFDGTVARLTGKSSKVGAFLDLVFDRVVETVVIFSFYIFMPQFALMYFLFYIGMMFNYSTFVVAGALFKNTSNKGMHYDIGIVERTETFIAFSAMMFFPLYINIILGIFNTLMIATGIIRMVRIIKNAEK